MDHVDEAPHLVLRKQAHGHKLRDRVRPQISGHWVETAEEGRNHIKFKVEARRQRHYGLVAVHQDRGAAVVAFLHLTLIGHVLEKLLLLLFREVITGLAFRGSI